MLRAGWGTVYGWGQVSVWLCVSSFQFFRIFAWWVVLGGIVVGMFSMSEFVVPAGFPYGAVALFMFVGAVLVGAYVFWRSGRALSRRGERVANWVSFSCCLVMVGVVFVGFFGVNAEVRASDAVVREVERQYGITVEGRALADGFREGAVSAVEGEVFTVDVPGLVYRVSGEPFVVDLMVRGERLENGDFKAGLFMSGVDGEVPFVPAG